jgi:DNA-binding XRE family transcriptional regulator
MVANFGRASAMFVKRRPFAQARRAAGYTQESLAERLSVDRTTVARWESGEYSPQPWLRPKIAKAFGISLGELSELVDGRDTTGRTIEVSSSLVKADGVLLAGDGQVPASTPELDRLSPKSVLAEVQALQARAPLPQVPWDMDRLAVSTA